MGKNKKYERHFETLGHPLEWAFCFSKQPPNSRAKNTLGNMPSSYTKKPGHSKVEDG
jgi:hypothetical protein